MASANLLCVSLGRTFSHFISRRITCCLNFQMLHQHSTSEDHKGKPVTYTTSEASKLSFEKNIGIDNDTRDTPRYQSLVIATSLAAFLIYFCILREENDIDEQLKGNPEYQADYAKLMDLKWKIEYCKLKGLSTEKLESKMDELQQKLNVK